MISVTLQTKDISSFFQVARQAKIRKKFLENVCLYWRRKNKKIVGNPKGKRTLWKCSEVFKGQLEIPSESSEPGTHRSVGTSRTWCVSFWGDEITAQGHGARHQLKQFLEWNVRERAEKCSDQSCFLFSTLAIVQTARGNNPGFANLR